MDSDEKYEIIDEALSPVSSMVKNFTNIMGAIEDSYNIMKMDVEQIDIEMPIEMDIYVDEKDNVVIGNAPPTQHVETSFMPVFHNLKISIVKEENNNGE